MRKYILLTAFAVVSLCCNAQFKLTPTAGLITEDGPYTILRSSTEADNYEAAKKAVEAAIPDAQIGELEYEKLFSVVAKYKEHSKIPGALFASDWSIDYTLKVEVTEDKIFISFDKIGSLENRFKNNYFYVHPTAGKNSMLADLKGGHYLFNSSGQISKGGKKFVALFENMANGIVKNIENNL